MHCFLNVFAFAIALVALVVLPSHGNDHKNPSASKLVYPKVRRVNQTFSYRSAAANGNVTVADPYDYLESSSSKDVQTFIDQQTAFFKTYTKNNFKDLDSIRASIKEANHYDELQFPEAFG
jgi:Prolyl oligopeptidase, N-terminal beta-propeller domain